MPAKRAFYWAKGTDWKAMSRETLPTEVEIESRLKRGEVEFPPLKLTWDQARRQETSAAIDGGVRITWQKKTFRFAVECKRLSNPKTLRDAFAQARRNTGRDDLFPLVVVPYLNERSIDELESECVSGIDLCGNGIVTVPGELFVRRTGATNRFQTEGVIKNVYRNSSSVVARLFLAQPEFHSVQDALGELVRRGGRVTLSTVSKVCKAMENDLILERKRGGKTEQDRGTKLRLLQPEKLLVRLAENYTPASVASRQSGQLIGIEPAEARDRLRRWADKTKNQIAITGTSSVGTYAIMAREGVQEFYCTDVAAAVRLLGDRFQPTDRFATLRFLQTRDEEVYFDRRDDLNASPVQTFLELSSGDKRDQETADQVKGVIMNGVRGATAKTKPRR